MRAKTRRWSLFFQSIFLDFAVEGTLGDLEILGGTTATTIVANECGLYQLRSASSSERGCSSKSETSA